MDDQERAGAVVFVVDDDLSMREALSSLLRSVGWRVQIFSEAAAFLAQERPAAPSCLLLDVRMPGMSGLELQLSLAAVTDAPPIVFMTAHGSIPMSVQAMKAGAVEFLAKPFREQDLLDAVDAAIEQDACARRGRHDVADTGGLGDPPSRRERDTGPSMGGTALSVHYLSATMPEPRDGEHACDAIEILIPGDDAALSATYRTAEGREFTAFVRAPMIAVIPPGQAYRVSSDHAANTLVLQLAADFFDAQVREALGTPAPLVVARYAAFDPFMRELGDALQERLQHAQQPNHAYVQPLAGVIAMHLARHYGSDAPPDTPPVGLPQHKFRRVRAFIGEHIAEVLHVGRLAAEVHLSPFHFARMFKVTTGQTPHLYVLMQRVERAKALLCDSETTLIDIAALTGFRTQSHFTGVFRRYTGLTPRAFRLARRAAQQG